MDEPERAALAGLIVRTRGSAGELKTIFDDLVDRVGRERASQLWWAVFGAEDATET
ncbi:MAG: hypothetical protein ACERLM_12180 [Acidimicrobiales bacterium]